MASGARQTPHTFYAGNELVALSLARNYYRWISSYFRPFIGPSAVEVGAGIGTFSQHLLTHPELRRLVMMEPAENLWPVLQDQFSSDRRTCLVQGYLEDLTDRLHPVDSVVSVNVLEHVFDDVNFLRAAHRVLRPGGHVLLFVPALPSLYGSLDRAFSHHRRYTKHTLSRILQEAGFHVVMLRYVNLVGILTWTLAGKVFRRTTVDPWQVILFDRMIASWLSKVERRWEPPVGQNILAVARNG